MGSNESKYEQYNNVHVDPPKRHLKPLTQTFNVEKLKGETQKPFCIYSFAINRTSASPVAAKLEPGQSDLLSKQKRNAQNLGTDTDDEVDKVAWRIKELVLEKALDEWLDKRKIEDHRLYLIDMRVSRFYTQFVIERPKFVKGGDPECCMKRQITVQVPRLIGSNYVPVEESYDLVINTVGEPIRDLKAGARDPVLQQAIMFVLLADVLKEKPSFGFSHSKQNIGRVYNLTNERHKRVAELTPCLRSCRGISLVLQPLDKSNLVTLKLTEEMAYYFRPVNMIELLMSHFNFDVNRPLDRNQIDAIKQELIDEPIEMRPCNLGNSNKSSPEVHITTIRDVSHLSICDEQCDSFDESGKYVGKTTVDKQFERDFPHVKLRYKHLPCLISSKGRPMPIEMCWIHLGQMYKKKLASPEEKFDPDQLMKRTEIFEENCNDFIKRHRSTSKKFGFQLKPISGPNQKISNKRKNNGTKG